MHAEIQARWTVGLGIEHQLNELVACVMAHQSLPIPSQPQQESPPHPPQTQEQQQQQQQPDVVRVRDRNLDYAALVRPEIVEATLVEEVSSNKGIIRQTLSVPVNLVCKGYWLDQ